MPDQGALVTVRRHARTDPGPPGWPGGSNRITVPVNVLKDIEWVYEPYPPYQPKVGPDVFLGGKVPVNALSADQRAAWIKGREWSSSDRRKPPGSYLKVFIILRDNGGSDVYRQLSALADAREKAE